VCQFCFLALAAIVSVSQAIGTTFNAADPFTRLLILALVGYVLYRAARLAIKKRGHA